jgi:hypothetical protein
VSGARSLVGVVAAVAACCGVAWLLVAAGVMAATGGLLSSPELTVAAAGLALWGLAVLVVRVRRIRRGAGG